MRRVKKVRGSQGSGKTLQWCGVIVLVLAVALGLWVGVDLKKAEPGQQAQISTKAEGKVPKNGERQGLEKVGKGSKGIGETKNSGSHRQPLQYRAKMVEPEAVLAVLASGAQKTNERVQQLQGMRGILLSEKERERALAFLAGKEVPEGISKGSMHWLADELLTVLRMQQPPWNDLGAELAKVAFQAETDPVVRDYMMQHLGHLWEQHGSSKAIDSALWRAVASTDETTAGTALIALSRGYERDQKDKSMAEVRKQALKLAQDSNTGLAVRVSALSIAGDGGGEEVRELAAGLAKSSDTPVILKKVAEQIGR